MTAGSEEPGFVPPADESAEVDRGAHELTAGTPSDPPRDFDEAAPIAPWPPPFPWHWLAWAAIALGAVLFGRSWWRAEQRSIAAERTNEAIDRLTAGRVQEAVVLLTEAVEHDPSLAVAWANRAAAHIRLDQLGEARRDCEMALKLEPDNFVALTNLGSILQETGDFDGAREALTRSIASNPAAGQAWLSRAMIALTLDQHQAAVDDATEALRLLRDPHKLAHAHEVRGAAFLALHNYSSALSDFSEASRIEPDRPEHQLQMADCDDARGDIAAAETHVTNAIELSGDTGQYYEKRASLRLRLKKFAEAVDDCTRTLDIDPKSARALMFRAAARIEQGRFVEAITDCDAALEIDSALVSAHLVRGDAQRRNGEPIRAIDDYSEAIRQNPELMMAWFGRGVARSQMRDYDAAIADYSRVIELAPDFAPAWYNRALAFEALGKVKEAKTDREKALELDPNIGSVGRTEAT